MKALKVDDAQDGAAAASEPGLGFRLSQGLRSFCQAPSSPNSADETNKTVLFWASQQD